jgi:hypothetical protein
LQLAHRTHLRRNACLHPLLAMVARRDDRQAMHTPDRDQVHLLPGSRIVLFLVRVEGRRSALAVPAAEFLDGLRAAMALLSFGGPQSLHRDDTPLDELLPWAGSV